MDQAEISHQLMGYIQKKFNIDDDDPDFDMDVHLFNYGYIDSFGGVELTSFVESQFGISITDTDLVIHPLNSISEITDFIVKRKGGII